MVAAIESDDNTLYCAYINCLGSTRRFIPTSVAKQADKSCWTTNYREFTSPGTTNVRELDDRKGPPNVARLVEQWESAIGCGNDGSGVFTSNYQSYSILYNWRCRIVQVQYKYRVPQYMAQMCHCTGETLADVHSHAQRRVLECGRGAGAAADWRSGIQATTYDEPDVPVQRPTLRCSRQPPRRPDRRDSREPFGMKQDEQDERLCCTLAAFGFSAAHHSSLQCQKLDVFK